MLGPVKLEDIPVLIAAIGALGIASFGIVDAVGKALFVFDIPLPRFGPQRAKAPRTDDGAPPGSEPEEPPRRAAIGLPYVGFGKVRRLARQLAPALIVSYGDEYDRILRQQYRAGRSQGEAPETIRQGVRLGLPFLAPQAAQDVIAAVWGLPKDQTAALAEALTAEKRGGAEETAPMPEAVAAAQALAARFATALDTRVDAAFELAEEIYQARARLWAAVVAIGLSLGYHAATAGGDGKADGWLLALVVGLAAVPLAPVAKDLSSSLSDALNALGKLRGGAKA